MSKKIGMLLVGINGSIGTTTTAGLIAISKGLASKVGLVSELDEFKNSELVDIEMIVVGGWDIVKTTHFESMKLQRVVPEYILESIATEVENVKVFQASQIGVSDHIKCGEGVQSEEICLNRQETVIKLKNDIKSFIETNNLDGCVVMNIASTEPIPNDNIVFSNLNLFEQAIENNDDSINSGMLYAYASILSGCPYINFTPSLTVNIPALIELAEKKNVPIAGNDGKTGQTLYKTVLAPMLKWRNLRLDGWYSTNILGNNDGRVLEDPEHKKSKIKSKSKVLDSILGYNDFFHKVDINYYPPRGDAKEAWDTIDFHGWLGSKMSMKINWLGEDSTLAAPLLIDLTRFIWRSFEQNQSGVAKQLSFFFKDPINNNDHNFFNQVDLLREYYTK